jgi:hypothetical protein
VIADEPLELTVRDVRAAATYVLSLDPALRQWRRAFTTRVRCRQPRRAATRITPSGDIEIARRPDLVAGPRDLIHEICARVVGPPL